MYPQGFVIEVLVIQVPLPSLSMTILKICLPTDLPIVVDVFCRHSVRRTSPVGEFFVRSSRSRDNDCLELRIYINMIVCWILHTVVVSCFRTTILLMEKSSEIASRKTEYNASMDWSRTFSDVSYTCQPSHTWLSCECHMSLTRANRKHRSQTYKELPFEPNSRVSAPFHIKCLQVISKFKNFRCYDILVASFPHLPLSRFYSKQNVTTTLRKMFGSRVKISKSHVIWLENLLYYVKPTIAYCNSWVLTGLQVIGFERVDRYSSKKSVLLVLIFLEVSLVTFSSIQFDSFPICKL